MALPAFPLVDPSDAPAAGGTVTAKFSTTVVTAANGREQRRALWTAPRHEISVAWQKGQDPRTRLNRLYDFYLGRKGNAEAFVYVDFDAGRTWTSIPVGTGTGAKPTFVLPSYLASDRTLKVDGVVSAEGPTAVFRARADASGRDTFSFGVAPAAGKPIVFSFTGRRAFVVRFADDALSYQAFSARLYSTGVKLVEVFGEDA